MILPVVFLIGNAFKPLGELFKFPPTIFAHNPTLDNFKNLMNLAGSTGIPMSRYFLNSMIVTVLTVVLNLLITIMAAYVFSKKKFKIKGALWEINQMALMFVATAVSIPRYLIIIPLTKPALATSVVLTFQQVWSNVETSNNYITNEALRTLTYYVNSIGTNNAVAASGMVAAANLIMFIPNLIIFICMQSKVMNTMASSGIK